MKFTFTEAFRIMLINNSIGIKRCDESWLDIWEDVYIFVKDGQICKAFLKDGYIRVVDKKPRLCQILKEDTMGGYDANKTLLKKEWQILDISEIEYALW